MLNPRLYLLLVFIFIVGVFLSIENMLARDPFLEVKGELLVNSDGLSGTFLGRLKESHGFSSEPYEIGIFGSSTSIMVRAGDMGLGKCRFFNFSIHGESLRNSVVVLERLAARGKLPPLVLIGLDNFEIQNYGNSRVIPLAARIREFTRDVLAGFREPGIGMVDVARIILRHFVVERDLIKRTFNFDLLYAAVRSYFYGGGQHLLLTTNGPGFRKDGSYNWKKPRALKPPPTLLPTVGRTIAPGYLRYDLLRIRKLADGNVKIFLFETPVEPASASNFVKNPGPAAMESRKAFRSACQEFGLNCFTAPERLSSDPLFWQDRVHSPPAQLGAYFRRMVPALDQVCRRDI